MENKMNKEEIIKLVDERVKKELERKYNPDMIGYIHIFEERKKEILEKEYHIKFKTTREKSKGVNVD
jgi:hypothetical protein